MDRPGPDAVPEEDPLEHRPARGRDAWDEHRLPPDASDADAFEQDLPLGVDEGNPGIDAERIEPFDDEDREGEPGS